MADRHIRIVNVNEAILRKSRGINDSLVLSSNQGCMARTI